VIIAIEEDLVCGLVQNAEENLKEQTKVIIVARRIKK